MAGPPKPRSGHRRLLVCLLLSLPLLAATALTLYLSLTLLFVRDPPTTFSPAVATGTIRHISYPPLRLDLDLAVATNVTVHNPNAFSFSHNAGRAVLRYRGAVVGAAAVPPGRLPPHGEENMKLTVEVDVGRLVEKVEDLVRDVQAGAIALGVEARIPGRVTVWRFIRIRVVAVEECGVVVGVPEMRVRSQKCRRTVSRV